MHVNVWGHIGNPGHHLVYDGIDLTIVFYSRWTKQEKPQKCKSYKKVDDNGQISYNINIENFIASGDRKNFIEVKPNDTIIISQTFPVTLLKVKHYKHTIDLDNLGVQIGNIYN